MSDEDDDDSDPFGLNEFDQDEDEEEADYGSDTSEDEDAAPLIVESAVDHLSTHSDTESEEEKDVKTSEKRESRYSSFDSPTPIRGLKTRDLESKRDRKKEQDLDIHGHHF